MKTLRLSPLVAVLLLACVAVTAHAQLTGTKTIPGDYATIAQAIDSLNLLGVGPGGVQFDIAPGHTEAAANLLITDTTSSSSGGVTFRKAGPGVNPLITAAAGVSTTQDAVIKIVGTDYITFDGVDLLDLNPDVTTQMEWGYALLKANAGNGAQHVTIRNCAVTLKKANPLTTGIYSANHTAASTTALTLTSAAGGNSDNRFSGNSVAGVQAGIALLGYNQSGAPWNLYDQRNVVGGDTGNVVTDFGGGSSTCYGIYTTYQNDLLVEGNTVNGGAANTATTRGIYTSSAFNANVTVLRNTITMATASLTSAVYAIQNAAGGTIVIPGTANRVVIADNIIENAALTGLTSSTVYMIYNTGVPADCEIRDNIIRNNSKSGTGAFYILYQAGNVVDSAIVRGNSITGNSSTGTGLVYGIFSNPGTTTTSIVENNTVSGTATASSSTIHYGIAASSGLVNVLSGNTVRTLSSAGGTIYGIYHASTTAGMTGWITANKVYNLVSTGPTAVVSGINVNSGASVYVVNNMVSDLRAPTAGGAIPAVTGLDVDGGSTVGLYYNSVFLNASGSDTAFSTAGAYTSTAVTVDLRNNNVVNLSTPGTAGATFAHRRGGVNPITLALSTNNNNWYAGTPGGRRFIYGDGTNTDSTLALYQARVTPKESASLTESAPFVNAVTPPYDLHINPAGGSLLNAAGTPVSAPINVTVDLDGDTRDLLTPDVGADEFTPSSDLTPPAIVYTPLGSTGSLADRQLIAAVTDAGGVAGGTNAPRLYYRKSTDTLWAVDTAGAPSGDNYTFDIAYALVGGASVAPGDTIVYYAAAQDVTGNAATLPAGGSGSSPPGATPPPSPDFYAILATPPGCAGIVSPADTDTAVAVSDSLVWSAPGGPAPATGYRIFFGTDDPPTNILNGADLGTALSYDPPGDLTGTTPYYWKIVPYNTQGDASGCPVWSFTTGVPPIVPANVTFRVNMKAKMQEGTFLPDSGDVVTVRGGFNDWGNSTNNPDTLTDGDNDSIFVKTLALAPSTNYEYKFWKTLRGGLAWEDGVSPNRAVLTGTADTTLPAPYFNNDGPLVDVTFLVNMTVQMQEGTFLPDSGDVVKVRGNFNAWGESVAFVDENANGIYTATLSIASDRNLEYKFYKTLRGGLDWENSISNRQFFVPLETPSVILPDFFDKDSVAELPGFLAVPGSIAFGGVTVGDSASQTVWVFNTGLSTLTISAVGVPGVPEFTADPASGAIAAGDSLHFTVKFKPVAAVAYGGNLEFTHNAAGSPGVVTLSGTGLPAGPAPKFLSITPDTLRAKDPVKLKLLKPVKRAKPGKPILPPNWANLFDETVAQGGFQPGATEGDDAGGMVVGISHMFEAAPTKWKVVKDSAAVRAWVRLTKWNFKKSVGKSFNTLQKTMEDKTGIHDLLPVRGFTTTTDGKNKPILKQQTKLVPKKQDSPLFAELVAFKFNIAASQLGKTPEGYGDLIFDVPGSFLDEMTLLEISETADSMMTYYQLYTQVQFDSLYSAVRAANRAFLGPLDTLSFMLGDSAHPFGKLVLKGQVEITSVPYLRLPSPFVATRVVPTTAEVESEEEFGSEEFEEGVEAVPVAAKLYQNYPNPFNPATTISFSLLEESRVTVRIFDLLGREVATLLAGEEMEEGVQEVVFDAGLLSSGVYFYGIDAEGLGDAGLRTVSTQKMMLLK